MMNLFGVKDQLYPKYFLVENLTVMPPNGNHFRYAPCVLYRSALLPTAQVTSEKEITDCPKMYPKQTLLKFWELERGSAKPRFWVSPFAGGPDTALVRAVFVWRPLHVSTTPYTCTYTCSVMYTRVYLSYVHANTAI